MRDSPRTRIMLELIDNVYEDSIERLAREALKNGPAPGNIAGEPRDIGQVSKK